MSISALSDLLGEVAKDQQRLSRPGSSLLYTAHLQALEKWQAQLPNFLRLRTPSPGDPRMVHFEADERQKAGIVSTFFLYPMINGSSLNRRKLNVQSLFLGTMCELSRPALMALLGRSPLLPETEEFIVYARRWYVPHTFVSVTPLVIEYKLCDSPLTNVSVCNRLLS
jgi:hypothetical protein